MILLHPTKFRVNRIIIRRDIAKRRFSIWRPSAILNLKNFRILLSSRSWNHNLHLHTKFSWNRIIFGWDIAIKLFSKWRPSAILNFRKFGILVIWLVLERDSTLSYKVSHQSGNYTLRYSQKTIFNMAAVRHIGFVVTSSYFIRVLCVTFLTLC